MSRLVSSPLDTGLYRFAYWLLPWCWRHLFRMEITGLENIPSAGPVIVAANHRSNLDPFFLGVTVQRQLHFMAKVQLWKFWVLGKLIDALGAFPVSRGEGDSTAVRRALDVLQHEAVLGLFPEGHRHRDGKLGELNPGVAMFALKPGVVTVPVAMDGTERAFHRGMPRLPKVRVAIGAPIELPPPGLPRSERAELVRQQLAESLQALLEKLERQQ